MNLRERAAKLFPRIPRFAKGDRDDLAGCKSDCDESAICTCDRDDPAICESDHTDAPICKSNRDDLAGREKQLRDSARPKAIAMIAKVAKQLRWYRDACG